MSSTAPPASSWKLKTFNLRNNGDFHCIAGGLFRTLPPGELDHLDVFVGPGTSPIDLLPGKGATDVGDVSDRAGLRRSRSNNDRDPRPRGHRSAVDVRRVAPPKPRRLRPGGRRRL